MLATETYGMQTNSTFSTYQEMNWALDHNPYLVKMIPPSDRWDVPSTQMALNGKMYIHWMPKTDLLDQIVDEIVAKVRSVGGERATLPMGESVEHLYPSESIDE